MIFNDKTTSTGCIKKNAILNTNANILDNLISKLMCLNLF